MNPTVEKTPRGVLDSVRTHSLGHRAFFLFLSRRLKLAVFLFVLAGVGWYAERWLPPSAVPWGNYVLTILWLLGSACLIFALMQTWFEYSYYTYTFTEEAFIMTYGVMVRNEVAALYHQIQNVIIQRTVLDRAAGVSQIIIFMTGADRDSEHSKIVLPAVGRRKARLVQKELLVRARRHAAE
jgi:membrane protein YdbS with pleckstrin-like domain